MDEKALKALIGSSPKCYLNSSQALKAWMHGVPRGTEQEAHKLNVFIEVWKDVFRFRDKKSRERREAMIRCDITTYIDDHIQQLYINNKPLCASSLKLYRYGLYGPDAENPVTKTQKAKDRLVVHDALVHHRSESPSIRSSAKDMNLDRKTVRKHRSEKDYGSSFQVIQGVLQKVDQKNQSKTNTS